MKMQSALKKDMDGNNIDAVKSYEKEIEVNSLPDHYKNLAFLYWSFAFEFFEFSIPNKITDYYSIISGNRYRIVLVQGLDKYPNSLEIHFWKKYFQHIIYSDEFSIIDCQELIEKYVDRQSIVPYFYLYLVIMKNTRKNETSC